ncbi:hydrolase [Streptomyces sp. RS10V-4]|uniref:acyl-CoA dehydrogenase family protein n=1 Tax=Streptomyces rhizoryzae TaxID=2932493 RepID=UPI002003FE75|nr:acyl-CoA dehydrogenase family protein [Streptomyces rhizoryzae]MCK7625836.1 hydrolase [Streptomyces rhizoryzae]
MPGPHPSTSRLSDTAALRTVAGKLAAEADARRRLSPQVAGELLAAGFARHFVPAAHGGAQGTFTDLVGALHDTARACASAAWCGLIYATSGRMAAYLPGEGRAALWADGPDRPIAAALVPGGTATPVAGGWRLTGQWQPLSAIDHADWALVCVPDPAGPPAGPWFMALPRADFTIDDTWFPAGLRGTGSNTLVADGVFVPAGRACRRADLAAPGPAAPAAPCYRVPLQAVAGLPFAAVAVGVARGALDDWSAGAAAGPLRDQESAQLLLARSTADTDAARLLLDRAARAADDVPEAHARAARCALDACHAAQLARTVVSRLFEAAGSAVQQEGSALQRAWRDIHAAASHATLRFDRHGTAFARGAWAPRPATGRDLPDDGGRT